MLDRENELVKIYRQARDRYKETNCEPFRIRLIANRETDGREDCTPTNVHEFDALVADNNLIDKRDIILEYKGGGLHRISELNPSYMALHYPLLFPHGEDGFRIDILHRGVTTHRPKKRDQVSMRAFYAYRFQQRKNEGQTVIRGGRLFLQYVVDAYTCVEHGRLLWVQLHQEILRVELYNNIVDCVNRGDVDARTVGKRIVLPASFTGSPRYMQQNYQDCMAVCRKLGSPNLFITFTYNPAWPEIKDLCAKIPNQTPDVRPDIICRVFKIKLDMLLEDLMHNHVLGKAIAGNMFFIIYFPVYDC